MIAAIMQPYFFPYLGYFQLMGAVDVFVFYDDAQYITRGWVNRNRIRVGNAATWITLPIAGASARLPINDRNYLLGPGSIRVKNQLGAAYRDAPAYAEISLLLHELLDFPDPNVAAFNINLLIRLGREMGLACEFRKSSELGGHVGLRGEERIIDMCRRLGVSEYVNPVGGSQLYHADYFHAAGIGLSFLKSRIEPEELDGAPQYLSVVDLLMREGFPGCAANLPRHELASQG